MADEPQRHRIEVVCPDCGHRQKEPLIVVSSRCRACQTHFQVIDGKAVARDAVVKPFSRVRSSTDESPSDEPAAAGFGPPLKRRPADMPKRSLLERLFDPVKPPRDVTCFECDHPFQANGGAQSSQCPKCGNYISLINYEIDEPWNRNIQTRGDVVILKSGSISGATVRCHQLTVLGGLAGSVECSGDLIIRSHGKIIGTVKCRHLRVEKGARVEFLNPVHAQTASIDGQVKGQISCGGSVTLEKRAQLHGLVRTSSLVVKPGAKHSGMIEMVTATES